MLTKTFFPVAVAAVTVCAGCVSVNPDPAFSDVQQMVLARTGQNPRWIKDEAAHAEIEQITRGLLEGELAIEAAVQVALLNNPSLQATYEEIGVSQADLAQAARLKNPELGISVRVPDRRSLLTKRERAESWVHQLEQLPSPRLPSQSNNGSSPMTIRGPGESLLSALDFAGEALNRKVTTTTNIEFAVAEDLLDLIMLPVRKKLAQRKLEVTKLRVGSEVIDLIAEVKKAYYTVQAREQLLHRLDVILDADAAAAELALKQYEAGAANELDAANQQTLHVQTRIEQAQAQAQVQRDREALNRLMGVSGLAMEWTIASELPEVPNEAYTAQEIESLAFSKRLDLIALNNQIAFAARSLSVTKKTRLLPTHFDVGFNAERGPDRLSVSGATLGLDVPLFDQGQAKVGRLQAQVRQAERMAEALHVQIRMEVRDANTVLDASRVAAQAYRNELLPKRAKILELTLQHYNFMLKGTYDLLLARQEVARTERSYIESARDYWIARSELERAVGGGLTASPKPADPEVSAKPAAETKPEAPAATPPSTETAPAPSSEMQHEHH